MVCLKCGSANDDLGRFCVHCGNALSGIHELPTETFVPSQPSLAKTPTGDQLIGHTIEGKYRLEAKLGLGGMGAVYRATRLHIGDQVAVKILHPEQVVDQASAERFRREARMAALLKHPNAVSIYDFGISSNGLMYLVMELVEGQSLRQVLREQGKLDSVTVAEITGQICAALDEAHQQQVIHRDIKPDNIIVNTLPSGMRVKVLDFGIAKLNDVLVTDLTQPGSVVGTPYYMSPEQCLGEVIDLRSDIYSLGVVMFELLCGAVPFKSPTSTAVVVQHVTQAPPPLRTINPAVSPEVEAVVLHALQKKREARPQTAGSLAREFHHAVYGPPAGASSVVTEVLPVATDTPRSGSPTMTMPKGPVSAEHSAAPRNLASSTVPAAARPRSGGGAGALVKVLIGVALVVVLVGGTAAVMLWLFRSNGTTGSGNRNGGNANVTAAKTDPAKAEEDAAFKSIHEKLQTASKEERELLMPQYHALAAKYPNDYRFTLDLTRMHVTGTDHHYAFEMLYAATRAAITTGQTDQMLADLSRDVATTETGRLKDHPEFALVERALTEKDASVLDSGDRQPHKM